MDQATALVDLACFVGITFPTLYCGITADYSFTFIQPIVDHAPNQKVMAKQWYQGYRYGPLWVPHLVGLGTMSNILLAVAARTSLQRNVYIAAALMIFSILPITFFCMEPGINGALKWKVQSLLKDEGMQLSETSVFLPSTNKHGSTMASRRWAERTELRELVLYWRYVNNVRWVLGGVAAGLSGYATFHSQVIG